MGRGPSQLRVTSPAPRRRKWQKTTTCQGGRPGRALQGRCAPPFVWELGSASAERVGSLVSTLRLGTSAVQGLCFLTGWAGAADLSPCLGVPGGSEDARQRQTAGPGVSVGRREGCGCGIPVIRAGPVGRGRRAGRRGFGWLSQGPQRCRWRDGMGVAVYRNLRSCPACLRAGPRAKHQPVCSPLSYNWNHLEWSRDPCWFSVLIF